MNYDELRDNFDYFLEKFNDTYKFLYDNYDNVAGYRDAVTEYDERVQHDEEFKKFVWDFVDYRRDLLVSDRECASFMFTLADMGY